MKRYFGSEHIDVTTDIDTSDWRDLEIVALAEEIRQSEEDQIWHIGIGGSISVIPLYHKGVVYFGCWDKNFYALDAETGKEKWRFPTQGPIVGGNQATIHEDTIYFCSQDGNLYCLNLEGKEKWRFDAKDKVSNTAVIYKNRIYFGNKGGKLFVLDLNGREKWTYNFTDSILSPVISGDRIYISCWDRNVYCLSIEGELIWKFPLPEKAGHMPMLEGKRLFVTCRNGDVFSLSIEGKLLWKFHTKGPVFSLPLFYKGMIYFGSWDMNFYCLDADTGREIWRFGSNHINYSVPVAWKDTVFFTSIDNNLYAISLEGKLRWKFKANGPIPGRCTIGNGKIYFGSWMCRFYCVDAATGREEWNYKTSMSSPAPIDVNASSQVQTVGIIVPEDDVKEEDRYAFQVLGSGESNYLVKSDYVKEHHYTKKRKVKSMSSGWE